MKRCSTCNRTFEDPNLSFCIDDGTPLTPVEMDDDTTVVRPKSTEPNSEPNSERSTEDNGWNATAYQPPGSYVPPGTEPKRRRAWPWVAGIAGAFILGILALSVAAAILIPRMRARRYEQPPVSNTNQAENSNVATENNANSNAHEDVDTPPPTEHEQVLGQLTNLEQEWTVANINADKKKLDRILADDFVGQDERRQPQSKADYIRTIQRDQNIDKWDFSDLKLTLAGDRATLTGIFTYFLPDRTISFDFTDKFVWRDGRWQATSSEIRRRGNPETDL